MIRVEQVRWCTALAALQLIQGVLFDLKFEQLSDSRFCVGNSRNLCSMEFEWFPEERIRCYFHLHGTCQSWNMSVMEQQSAGK